MPRELNYSIVGLQDYVISFEAYCRTCEIQQHCKFGKATPFSVKISCNDINHAKEKMKYEQLKKLQKKEDLSSSYEELIKKVKINIQGIFSEIWKRKIKMEKEEIRCLNSRKVDPILVTQQGQDWWQDFNQIIKEINHECAKIG
ncbi:MAG: hypothetical protein KGD63_10025 [Candidatus Lokiarchaeota archaeon]|nr:hypothetical protein [Candidatus Lokiarchaeota archaeon]